jgi:hypothetical protein
MIIEENVYPNKIILITTQLITTMKWLFTSKKSGQEIYELWNGEEKILELTCQPRSGSLRITTGDEKRVFLIGREGFLRSRKVLSNEYGIRIGQLTYESNQDNIGTIEFDNKRFNYSIQNHFHPELIIIKNDEIIASCELPAIQRKNFNTENYDILILTLCWYLFSIVKKQKEEYA